MKIIAGLQIALGILAEYLICYIAVNTQNSIVSSVFNSYPAYYKITLIIAGAIIFCLALVQYFKHTRLSAWHLICGTIIIISSSLLYTDALNFAYVSSIYMPTYLIMAAVLAVIVIGVIQIFKIKET
jgi:ABC-type cobalamin transport system permease subunit